jgi:DNA polymerase III delta prime subunit
MYDEDEGLSSDEPRFQNLHERLTRWHDLILLGPPGSGKTTTLWSLAHDLAGEYLQGASDARLPLLVELAAQQDAHDAGGMIQDALANAAIPLIDGRQRPLGVHRLLAQRLPELLASEQLALL